MGWLMDGGGLGEGWNRLKGSEAIPIISSLVNLSSFLGLCKDSILNYIKIIKIKLIDIYIIKMYLWLLF